MATKTAISEEEYLRTSFDNPDPEYRDGELVERSMPVFDHGELQGDLYAMFKALRPRLPVYPCVETRMKLRTGLYRIPDVAVFLGARPSAVPETPPLIAIEILSPDDRLPDLVPKLEEYRVWGVRHIWLVDPQTRSMFVYDGSPRGVSSLIALELSLELEPAAIFGN
jgi:Uma2 family endonuclease